jgi:REP element-mobilizing transposase RayT
VARQPRSELPDGVFHVTARSIAGSDLFQDDADRTSFVDQLTRAGIAFRWTCHAYCLMTNHYHLLIEASRAHLSLGMHRLNGNYAQSYNARHGRRGHLFEARFNAYVVEGDEYMERACSYVLQNPVRAGLCDRADQWPWSGGLVHLETVMSRRLFSRQA